jgi:hypothetical protein
MADFQRVVEFLRDLRQGSLQTVNEEITQAATEYAELCVQANERLRKCSSFLQQGLRTEALHLADESPNLLDLVAAIDLPDPQAWMDFCQNNNLPVPPPLQLDRAAQLNDAYAQDQPLEHLLTQHRLLALSRGPIGERLAILRKIASIDAGSTTWEKDIRVFEKARLKELPAEFYAAVKSRDDSAMRGLVEEIMQQPWFETVPADLSTAVADAFSRMQRAAVEVELTKMVEPLREAFAAQSFQECQALVQRWKNVMAASNVTTISPELTDEIRPVVAYVQEQEKRAAYLKKFRDSCRAFIQLLDADAGEAQLEMGYARLQEFKEPIPPELTERYQAKQDSRQRAIDRKHRTRMMGIGASAAGVALVVLVVVIFVNRASAAKAWAQKIEGALATKSQENLQQAKEYVAEVRQTHPSFLSETSLAAAIRDTDARQGDYERDSSTIQGLLGKFDAAQSTASKALTNPNASLDQLLGAAGSVREALTQAQAAGDLSWADSADKKFATGSEKLQETMTTLQARAAVLVRAELENDTAAVAAIGPAPANMSEASDRLGTIADRLRTIGALGDLDESTKATVAALYKQVDQRRQSLNAASTIAGELDNIRQNATTADDLKKALTGYLQRFPNDSRTADFTTAIGRMGLAKDVEAWREMTASWAGQFAPANAGVAQKRIDALGTYLNAHPNSPMTATASTYLDYLHRANDALADKGTWQQAFSDLFSNPLLTELAYLETSDGQRFYVLGDIKRAEHKINNYVSISFEAINPTDVSKRMLVSVDPPTTLATPSPVPAPHAKVVAELNDELKTIDGRNWETWGIDATDLVMKEKMNVVVKAILVEQLLKTETAVADWAISDVYAQAVTELSREKPESLSWLDSSRVSAGMVKSLQGTMDALPNSAAVKEKLAAAKTALFKMVSFDVTSTAVLLKDERGNWSVGSKTLATDGLLWTVLPGESAGGATLFSGASTPPPPPAATSPAGDATSAPAPAPTVPANPGTLVQIGTVTGGKYALYDNAVRDLPQGTIVFITQP